MKTKYVLAFCNLFLKIDLNCVTRFKNRFNIMLILNTHAFSKEICCLLNVCSNLLSD